mmetsp:Transcript_26034/g.61821  ORF Transcript_26034/g.61821 Transcript_26034/m.61821 type:complete len:276 (-) Transcript_26034:632-1459(-)
MTRQTPSSPTTAFHPLLTLDSAASLRDPANERRRGSSSGGASFAIHCSTCGLLAAVVVSPRPSIRIADGPVATAGLPRMFACGGGTFSSEKKSSARGIEVEALVGPSSTMSSSSSSAPSSATSIATSRSASGDELRSPFLPPSGSDASVGPSSLPSADDELCRWCCWRTAVLALRMLAVIPRSLGLRLFGEKIRRRDVGLREDDALPTSGGRSARRYGRRSTSLELARFCRTGRSEDDEPDRRMPPPPACCCCTPPSSIGLLTPSNSPPGAAAIC